MEKKICPVNPHGAGFCAEDRCALWDKDAQKPMCVVYNACRAICDAASYLNTAINLSGIVVYVKNGND